MPLNPGARLGSYEVTAQIGVGGMGEVYRARDMKLGRDVALKILPDVFVADTERQARFKREAQLLAALNHPNIAGIYGLEESDETRALVMELVEGPTLADRISEGRIPIDEALPIARQIAAALEAAHEAGIVHRDLKPANIKVREDSATKVLDFGLAKLADPVGALQGGPSMTQSPTITSPAMMTGVGVILGTAAYMSPEQAKGRPADKRSDIWAFGCVLYEMLTGRRAFEGDDVSDTLAAVLRGQPDWTALPADVTEPIRLLLLRCLERDRTRRISDISTAKFLMTESTLATRQTSAPIALPLRRPWWKRLAPIAASAIAGAAVVGFAVWKTRPQPLPPAVTRFTFSLPDDQRFTNGGRQIVALSPDGMRMAYVANGRLYLKAMRDDDARPLTGPQTLGITSPVFSPDGQWIAYWSAPGTLNKLAISGGSPVKLADMDNPFGMSWDGDSLLVGQGANGIVRVPKDGGPPEAIIKVKEDETAHGPQLLPDGRSVLFTVASGSEPDRWDQAQVVVQAIGSSDRTPIIRGGADGRYLRSGHLVYALGGVLLAAPFDVRKLEGIGGSVPVVDGVSRANGIQTGSAHFALSDTGTLVYVPGPAIVGLRGFEVALLDLQGKITRLKLPQRTYQSPRFSPNGQQLALAIDDGRTSNIWVYDLDEQTQLRQLTFGNNRYPIWTFDGARITFQSERENARSIFWQRADAKGQPELLIKASDGETLTPESWSRSGDVLLFSSRKGPQFSIRLFTLHDRRVQNVEGVKSISEPNAEFSSDGRWFVYGINAGLGNAGGPGSIFARPFPLTDERHLIGPGVNPFWAGTPCICFLPRAQESASFQSST